MSSYNPIPSDFTPEGHADPEGDVIFSLDTEGTLNDGQPHLLKVSSQTMSRASRAFNGMFNPRFTGRADFSPNDPLEIALPEDDYQAMTWICFALHLQDLPEGRIPLALLKEIALLADKYNLALNLQPWSSLWLHEWSGSSADDESYWELLWMAYALLDFQMFYEASQKLIYGKAMEDPDFDSEGLDDVGFSLLPAGIKASIKAQRAFATDNIQKLLVWVKPFCLNEPKNHDDEFQNELTRLGLMPVQSVLEEKGITHFIDKLHDVRMKTCVQEPQIGRLDILCQFGHLEMDSICKAKEAMLGMCLLCLKKGKETAGTDSFSTDTSYNIHFSRDRDVVSYREPGPSMNSTWSYLRYWRSRRTTQNDEVEKKMFQAIKNNNCMASSPEEHQRNIEYVDQCSDQELSEKRRWAEFFQYMEERNQPDYEFSASISSSLIHWPDSIHV